jgi:PAS domain S-box-containing protein
MLGLSSAEFRQLTWRAFTHPDDVPETQRRIDALVSGTEMSTRFTKRFLHKNGSVVWADLSSTLRRDVAGQPLYLMSTIVDITERKQAEVELERKNKSLTLLHQLSHSLNTLTSSAEIPGRMSDLICEVFDNRNLYIALYDEAASKVSFPIYKMHGKERGYVLERPLGNGLTEYVIRTRTPLLISDRLEEALTERGIALIGASSRCYLGVPMLLEGRAIGVVAVQDYERASVYDAGHVELLSTIATAAAIALSNARLHEGLEKELAERRRMEMALRASELRFRNLLEDIHSVAVQGYMPDGTTQYWNKASERLYGYSAEEAIGRNLIDLIIPTEMKAEVREAMRQMEATGQPIPASELLLQRKDGSRVAVFSSHAMVQVPGKPQELFCVDIDLTERKRAEEEVRKSEERFRLLFQRATDGVFLLSVEGKFVAVNESFARMHGYSEAEMLNMGLSDLDTPETAQLVPARMQRLLAGESLTFTVEHFHKDRHVFPLEVSASLIATGNTTLIQCFHRDITERKQAEERLRKQVTLLDSANDAIYVRALDHTLTYWNEGAERLYGWSAAETVGRKLTELGLVEPMGFATAHAALLAQGDWSGEVNKTGKDGKERVVFCRWTLLRDEQDHPREVLAINTDITEKKQLESQYLRAQRMEGIGLLAGGIAHDLNNILTPIMMSTSLLRDAVRDDENRQLIDSVQSSAQRGADIIRQLLTFARGQPGVRAPVPVRQLLREMERLIRETFPRSLRLTVTVSPELWPMVGDATQIHQALMNLCVNARDAMPDGGMLTLAADNITLNAASAALMLDTKPGPHVRLGVTDTGTGIPPAQLERIFDPFFTTKEIGQGTGLGLPTVLGIVRGHGGAVRVDSRVGQGTTFELYLPASSEAKVADTPERESRLPRGHGELILVVDDEAAVRGPTQRVLEKYGYRVLTAAEGEAALVLYARHRTEVKTVLTDMMMPGMDGTKLVRALREMDARLPILGMTGLIEQGTFKGLEGLDSVPLLAKPFDVEKLLGILHQTLTTGNPTTGSANDVGARDGLRDASR